MWIWSVRFALVALVAVTLPRPCAAQVAVFDPAVTLRNSVTATVKELLFQLQQEEHRKLRRMSRRLSMHTDLNRYALPDPPRWRTHGDERFLFSVAYNDALIFGDSSGAAYAGVVHPLLDASAVRRLASPEARAAFLAARAAVDVADATAIEGLHDSGRLRFNGRKFELPAVDVLQRHALDPSNEQSVTAVLEKVSGSVLVGLRQRQARLQLLTGILQQLLADNLRTRNAATTTMNLQLAALRPPSDASPAAPTAGEALRRWRQP